MMTSVARVLVIDDDRDIREFVKAILLDEGYEVVTAENGSNALNILNQYKPDLILLDMRMPIMDGWAFSKAYRQMYPNQAPIVVLTAATDAAQFANQINADSYLSKPFDLVELIDVVGKFS